MRTHHALRDGRFQRRSGRKPAAINLERCETTPLSNSFMANGPGSRCRNILHCPRGIPQGRLPFIPFMPRRCVPDSRARVDRIFLISEERAASVGHRSPQVPARALPGVPAQGRRRVLLGHDRSQRMLEIRVWPAWREDSLFQTFDSRQPFRCHTPKCQERQNHQNAYRHAHALHPSLMPAVTHSASSRPQDASLKVSHDLLRVSGSFNNRYRNSTCPERFYGARADSAAQYRLTISQRLDKSGVSMTLGGTVARGTPVLMMTTRIGAGLDKFHLPIASLEDEKLAAASKMGGNVDSIVGRYSNFHIQYSFLDAD